MPRFRKGTTDHDDDGRMGGSMKGDKTMAKATTKKAAAKKAPAKRVTKAERVDLEAERTAMATASDPQSGGAQVISDTKPSFAAVKKARKEAVEAQFAEADARGAPDLEAIRAQHQVRGF